MFIQIKGFRSIQNLECELHHDSITLLSGPSGIGKSTLMNAILWCMYGTLRNVRKFGTKSGTCMVKMDLGDGFNITRSKSPELFQVNYKDRTLKDKEGQDFIHDLFGIQEKWISCCYLKQGSRNLFLESSSSDRLQLLYQICFHADQNPDHYIEKIEEQIQSYKLQFDTKNELLKHSLASYQKNLAEFKDKFGAHPKILDPETFTAIKNKVDDDSFLVALESKYKNAWTEKTQQENIRSILNDFKSSMPEYVYVAKNIMNRKEEILKLCCTKQNEPDISECQTKIDQLDRQRQERNLWIRQLDELKKDLPDYIEYLDLDSKDISRQEQDILEKIKQVESNQKRKILEDQFEQLHTKIENHLSLEQINQQIIDLEQKIEQSKVNQEQKRRLQNILSQIHDYDLWNKVTARYVSQEELENYMHREKVLNELGIGLDTSVEQIQKAIEKRKYLIQIQPFFQKYEDILTKELEIEKIDRCIQDLGKREDWISEKDLPSKMIEYQTSLSVLNCPSCFCKLRFENQKLIRHYDLQNLSSVDLGHLIEISKKRIELKKQLQMIESSFNSTMIQFEKELAENNLSIHDLSSFPKLESSELEQIYHEVNLLESIPPPTEPLLPLIHKKWEAKQIESSILEINIDHNDLEEKRNIMIEQRSNLKWYQKEVNSLRSQISLLPKYEENSIDNLMIERERCQLIQTKISKSRRIAELESKIKMHDHLDFEIEQWKQKITENKMLMEKINDAKKEWIQIEKIEQIRKLESKIKDFDDPDLIQQQIIEEKKCREEANTKLEMHYESIRLLKDKEEFRVQREQVVDLNHKWISISKIKMIATELEHKRMVSTLNTLSDFANEILTVLFDEPIRIEFSVYKTTKTQKSVKPCINYKILYKGNEIDSIDQLSGGEGDRVSLAVTCAMFRFSSFPFLLLDEFGSSLDLNNKENAIQALRLTIGSGPNGVSKSILCISHDTVEGIYDYHLKI